MPTVPTVEAPTQQESGAPIGISAPAEAFGANVLGAGLAKLGATAQEGSDMLAKHAEQFQALNNKSEADTAFVAHLQAVNQFAADYQANNRGMKAYDNLPAAMTTISEQRDAIGNTLSNPMAKAMFDADSRRATANITGELTRFAASQRKESIIKTSAAVQEALVSDSVIHPDQFEANMKQMMEQQVVINEQLGLSPEAGALEARKTYANAVQSVTKTIAGSGDVQAASAFLEKHKEGMDGKIYADTVMQLKPALMANDAADIAHEAVTDSLHGMGSQVGPTVDYLTAVHGREGDGKNPKSTAEGVGQFTNPRFLDVVKKNPEFADEIKGKTDAQILEMRHDQAFANRAILANAQMNANYLGSKNLPVNPATVGMAHGYGPGGAEEIIHAIQKDPNTKIEAVVGAQVAKNNGVLGQSVSQVYGAFQQRFGSGSVDSVSGGPPTSFELQSRMQTVLSLVDQKVQAKYGDNALVRDQAEARAMAELNRQITAAKDREVQAYTTLGATALNNQIQDLPTLLKSTPGGLQMYNSLPLAQRTALQADVHRNATALTPERYSNINTLNGAYALRTTNPEAFLSMNIAQMDLPLQQKISYLKAQAELRAKPASTVDPNQKIIGGVMHSEQYKALTSSLGITAKSDEEYHLIGTLSGQIDAFNAAHPNQAPGPKDISAMLARAAGEQKYHYSVLGVDTPFGGSQKAYEISDADRTQAIAALQKLGRPTDEYNIARIVGEFHARQGAK
jgi:hypothetical protein